VVWNIIKNKFGMLIIGAIALAAGLYMYTNDEVTCGGQVMQAGDVCEHTKYGMTTSENSAEDEMKSQHTGGLVLSIVGGILVIAGVTRIILGAVRKPEEPVQPAQQSAPIASA
jgi:hypothetical protein